MLGVMESRSKTKKQIFIAQIEASWCKFELEKFISNTKNIIYKSLKYSASSLILTNPDVLYQSFVLSWVFSPLS